jgi:hypothetical protein
VRVVGVQVDGAKRLLNLNYMRQLIEEIREQKAETVRKINT